jgi:lipopolysaccharide export system permease protein
MKRGGSSGEARLRPRHNRACFQDGTHVKIIDRYVLGMFVKNYLIAFMVLIGMYIALDMVFNFASLTSTNQPGGNSSIWRLMFDIGNYYFYQSFFFYVQLSGMIAVMAASFTVMRLSRFNEMTALLAAGIPILRVAITVILAGVVLNLVLLPIDQEILIPNMIPQLIREHSDIHENAVKSFSVYMMRDGKGNLFNASRYLPPTKKTPAMADYLDVIERDAKLLPIGHILARSAVYDPHSRRWILTGGWSTPLNLAEDQLQAPKPTPVATYATDITPEDIGLNLGRDYIQLLSTQRLNQLLDMKRYGTLDLLRTKHERIAQPIVNVILLLLAVATVLTREPGAMKSSLAKCLIWSTACMALVFVTYQMAVSPPNSQMLNFWPALMAWTPIFVFGPVAVDLLYKVKT